MRAQPAGVVESMTFGSVTQKLASRLGTVREVASRNLARFRAEGLIQIEGRQARIQDRAGLEREAEEQS